MNTRAIRTPELLSLLLAHFKRLKNVNQLVSIFNFLKFQNNENLANNAYTIECLLGSEL